jgi:hypothetical protein
MVEALAGGGLRHAVTEREQALRRILDIGLVTSMRGEGLSLAEALERARYRELRSGVTVCDLLEVLDSEPDLVEQWLLYSEDKRTMGGWYILRNREIGRVLMPETRQSFDTLSRAVAEYVVRELDFWSSLLAVE